MKREPKRDYANQIISFCHKPPGGNLREAYGAARKVLSNSGYVLFTYLGFESDQGYCKWDPKEIQDWCGIGSSTYYAKIQELKDKGFLVPKKTKTSTYDFYVYAALPNNMPSKNLEGQLQNNTPLVIPDNTHSKILEGSDVLFGNMHSNILEGLEVKPSRNLEGLEGITLQNIGGSEYSEPSRKLEGNPPKYWTQPSSILEENTNNTNNNTNNSNTLLSNDNKVLLNRKEGTKEVEIELVRKSDGKILAYAHKSAWAERALRGRGVEEIFGVGETRVQEIKELAQSAMAKGSQGKATAKELERLSELLELDTKDTVMGLEWEGMTLGQLWDATAGEDPGDLDLVALEW